MALAVSAAQGQNALGDGRALDANLRVGSGGVNPKGRDLLAEIRFRNAIVTGNAPAGMSLRVGVGYTAADDFRQDLGSNDTFAFDRDAVYSSIAGRGVRGIEALQWQMRLTTGGPLDGGDGAQLLPVVSRAGSGASGSSLSGPAVIDPFTLRPRSLRSTTQYAASEALAPLVLGTAQLEEGERVYAVASPLRGVQMRSLSPDDLLPLPPSTLQALQELGTASKKGRDKEEERPASPFRLSGRIEPDQYSFDRVVSQLSERLEELRKKEEGAQGEAAQERIEPGRERREEGKEMEQLPGAPAETAPAGEAPVGEAAAAAQRLQEKLETIRQALAPVMEAPVGGREEEGEEEGKAERYVRRLLASSSGLVVKELTAPGVDPDTAYAQRMRAGEALLAQGRWFDAEEQFSRALAQAPGDPRASVGRVHAQIGAGLYVSAAVNLERLLLARPELAALRYDASLLPAARRLTVVTASLRRLIESGGPTARRAGLLLAYLGWQLGDAALTKEGVEAVERFSAKDDPTLRLIRAVWLAGGEEREPQP
ncbi:MAG: tetratricopeptide repeat protein [Planctomycetota bacterium]|nr:MAG: tetratricopeptide repeat protein [Planctomycetota bacterium]